MTLTQLEIFSTVAARRGFTAAAVQLGISQSGVSHAIEALEQEFGVALLRRGKNLELTDVGARLLRQAQAMLGLAESMRQEASDARGMKRGTLRIGSFGPTASLRLLPPVLEKYREVYPGIEIHVDEGPDSEVAQWLADYRVDIGFVTLPDDRFDTFPLMQDQLVALWRQYGWSVIFVTHMLDEAVHLADRVVVLHRPPYGLGCQENVVAPRPRRRDDAALAALAAKLEGQLRVSTGPENGLRTGG